jgi:hypothetical protein
MAFSFWRTLERFQAKRIPVRFKKTRKNKKLENFDVSTKREKALEHFQI